MLTASLSEMSGIDRCRTGIIVEFLGLIIVYNNWTFRFIFIIIIRPYTQTVARVQERTLQPKQLSIEYFFFFLSSHYTTPVQCWAQDLAWVLNSSRYSWVQRCGRMGQTSRCFVVCSSPCSHCIGYRPVLSRGSRYRTTVSTL